MAFTDYPIHLGLAYLFLVGYLVRTIFVKLRLPGAVGVICSGFLFSFFMQPELLQGRDHLQGLAFFLVLLTAGMEISIGDLKPYIILSATVPATFEAAGIAAYAHYVLDWTKVESCVLGITLFGIGDGLVIPKMGDFAQQFPGHPLPRFMFLWAPLEASYALTLFGIVSGVADAAGKATTSVPLLVMSNVLRIAATVIVGAAVGAGLGVVVSNRQSLPVPLTGTTVEAYLFVLATALAGFGMSSEETGSPMVPMGFTSGSLFQPELMVIVIGSLFARVVDTEIKHSVEMTMGGVWVFGQLVLFSMLGSRTDLSLFRQVVEVLPILAIGLSLRFVGVLLVTAATVWMRPESSQKSVLSDATFCFLSTLPRATLQGALGQVPITKRFFHKDGDRLHIQAFISMVARLYIVCMSIFGSILLDTFGPMMLKASCAECERLQQDLLQKEVSEKEIAQKHMDQKLTPVLNPHAGFVFLRRKPTFSMEEMSEESGIPVHEASFGPTTSIRSQRSSVNGPYGMPLDSPSHSEAPVRVASWCTLHQLEGKMVEGPKVDEDAMQGELAAITEQEEKSDAGDALSAPASTPL